MRILGRSCASVVIQLVVIAVVSAAARDASAGERKVESFDREWRFHIGDAPGAEKTDAADADWRVVDLPHDWSIEGIGPVPAAQTASRPAEMHGPFDRYGIKGQGYLHGGVAWYRKAFSVPASAKRDGRRLFIVFDGAYMDSQVYLNGTLLGRRPYGYSSFIYELNSGVKYGENERNEIAVRLDAQEPVSRWYAGAGINRHVWWVETEPVHVAPWGVYVTTPQVGAGNGNGSPSANVRVRTQVQNQFNAGGPAYPLITTRIIDAAGKEVAQADAERKPIAINATEEFDQTMTVPFLHRWSTTDPYLYRVVSEVRVGGLLEDVVETTLGVRTIEFTADNGFLLNGQRLQIQGVCDHHDLGCLGAIANRRGYERQLEMLKAMGCNAIRTSHNPPSPELLDLCDRMGFVVMDEAFDEWKRSKTRFGYGRFFDDWSERDLVDMIRRDRNHPSVVLWSIGNEIPEQGAPNGGAMAKRLADIAHREDPTRLVTSACNSPANALRTGYAAALDVFGINYNPRFYTSEKGKVLIGSETTSTLSTRGEYGLYLDDKGAVQIKVRPDTQCTDYDLDKPGWGSTAQDSLLAVKKAPWIAGEFVWTGFDYIGEPTPHNWPARSSYFGIIDLAGFPKDRYYLYKAQWTDQPVVHLVPQNWTWPKEFDGKAIPVWCYTNADEVELFLNEKSLGVKTTAKNLVKLHLEWSVPYTPGTLKAIGKKGGKVIATDVVRTAGKPAKIELVADRTKLNATPGGEDLSFVTVRVVDANGIVCPDADNLVTFLVKGPGSIAGVDNGDPTNLEPFQAKQHKMFHGMALVVVRASDKADEIDVAASSPGLTAASVTLTTTR